ncbi:MAG: ribonuclease D [Actinobacteria bacterium]|nr:ribonuclease D [Actinomycetota bacterium]
MEEVITAIPLLAPAAGVPQIIADIPSFEAALKELALGTGPFAVDAERASGFKFSARAYLIQIKRQGGGLHLIDPIPFGPNHPLFLKLNELLQSDEVILHASTQDLPCLRELGINPKRLFDTELGGRIAGLPRVGLGPLLESLMEVSLAKEHSAADWSQRPLPQEWLNYAALDVELLVELREKVYGLLASANKWHWAREEFQAILDAPPSPPRVDPWRRTSGMHKIKKRNQLAVVRALWTVRNAIAQEVDISQGRLLSDAAIVEIATVAHTKTIKTKKDLERTLRPLGLRARWLENSASWINAISDALALGEDQWPQVRSDSDSLPPLKIWRERFPDKYAPLTHAKALLSAKATELDIPLENMITPEYIRRICWNAPKGDVARSLATLGARSWQIEIAAPLLEAALLETVPLAAPESPEPDEAPTQM